MSNIMSYIVFFYSNKCADIDHGCVMTKFESHVTQMKFNQVLLSVIELM